MKMRNKGKVHPFTSSSSSSSSSSSASSSASSNNTDALSILKILPAAIVTLVSYLSVEEHEVLAYMISRSMKSSSLEDKKKASAAKKQQCGHNSPALFDCDCFHCYTSFWFRWDSSPNRELIHQAIEAFEDHLNSGESFKNSPKSKRRDKLGRRRPPADPLHSSPPDIQEIAPQLPEVGQSPPREKAAEDDDFTAPPPTSPAAVVRTHKGLARKVLPDVMGIFSSRLWSLWSPNV